MNTIISSLASGDVGSVILMLISVVLIVIGIISAKVLLLLAKKLGIDVDDQTMETIMELINKFVTAMNQSTVDSLKKMNPDGKLTQEEQEQIFNDVYAQVESSLTEEQKQYLTNKFNDLSIALKALIESSVNKNHK